MGLAQLMAAAGQAFGSGNMDAARHFLGEALKIDPQNPEILKGLSAVAYRLGNAQEAIDFIGAAISKEPQNWAYWEECIRIVIASGGYRLGAEICEQASSCVAASTTLLNYWSLCLQNLGEYELALEKLYDAAKLDPDNPTIHRNISLNLLKLGRLEESVEAFTRSTTPFDISANKEGQSQKRHELSRKYETLVIDYDENQLHIDMLETMYGMIVETYEASAGFPSRILDCGCGTGLLGKRAITHSPRIMGIDLSPEMAERARATGAYEDVIVGDMVEVLTTLDDSFDAVVCNDAIFYLADLSEFFRESARLLKNSGFLFIGTEPCSDAYEIRRSAEDEYAHSRRYLRRLAQKNGLEIAGGV